MSPAVTQALAVLKNELATSVEHQRNMQETRRGYSEEYAHKALVVLTPSYPAEAHVREALKLDAIKSAMWHEGSRDGHASGTYALVSLQKYVEQLEQALLAAEQDKQPGDAAP